MKIVNLVIIFVLIFGQAQSQYVIKVTDTHENFPAIGTKKAISVNIYDCKALTIKKAWAKLMSSTYSSNKSSWKNESFIDDVLIKDVSANTVDIYGMVKYSTEGELTFSIVVDMGGTFMTEQDHSKSYAAMKKIMYEFALEETKKGLAEKVKSQQKLLDTFKEDEEKINSEIKEYQVKMAEIQNTIKTKEEEKLEKQNKIQEQQQLLIKTMQITVK